VSKELANKKHFAKFVSRKLCKIKLFRVYGNWEEDCVGMEYVIVFACFNFLLANFSFHNL
jgi:hypothetical protein